MKKIIATICLVSGFYANAATPINQGASFDVGYSPNQGSLPLVIKAINSAQKSIHVAAYSFTSKPIATII